MSNKILIFGSYYNGISASRHFKNDTFLIADVKRLLCKKSEFIQCDKSILAVEKLLSNNPDILYIIPCSDSWAEILVDILDKFPKIKFLLDRNFLELSSKEFQRNLCEKVGVLYPNVSKLSMGDYEGLDYPLIIKPINDEMITPINKKNVLISNERELEHFYSIPGVNLDSLQMSIVIESELDSVYSFACLKVKNVIHNGWVGRKLIQYPNHFGVFAAAEVCENDEVRSLALKLIENINYDGFIQPEFKVCKRTKKIYLMEVNLRPMMWHGVALMNGINIYHNFIQDDLLVDFKVDSSIMAFYPNLYFLKCFGTKEEKNQANAILNHKPVDPFRDSFDFKRYALSFIKVFVSGYVKKNN